jgi:hypothetical protein
MQLQSAKDKIRKDTKIANSPSDVLCIVLYRSIYGHKIVKFSHTFLPLFLCIVYGHFPKKKRVVYGHYFYKIYYTKEISCIHAYTSFRSSSYFVEKIGHLC